MCGAFASELGLPGCEIRKENPHPSLSTRKKCSHQNKSGSASNDKGESNRTNS